MNNPDVIEQPEPPTAVRSSDLLGGKRETPLLLPNDTKIRFCNAFDAIKGHVILCKDCDIYLRWGDGDLCGVGKAVIAQELCFADTNLELPPNAGDERRPANNPKI